MVSPSARSMIAGRGLLGTRRGGERSTYIWEIDRSPTAQQCCHHVHVPVLTGLDEGGVSSTLSSPRKWRCRQGSEGRALWNTQEEGSRISRCTPSY